MKKILKLLLSLLLLTVLVGATFFVYLQNKYEKNYQINPEKEILIAKGSGLSKAARILKDNGIIDNDKLFVLYAYYFKVQNKLKAGEYLFSKDVSYKSVLDKLVSGDVVVRSVTIPEGKALVEIKKIISDNPYLSGDITIELKEGEILPETYSFVRGVTRDSILETARLAMKKTLKEAFAGRMDNLPIKDEHELLVLASIVEKETGIATERAKVASVFVNRLKIGMKLQTDPTVIYAVTNGNMDLGRPIYKKDLAFDSPYNTYVYAGLPPEPICSPGKEAIYAVTHPDNTKYLYFVADGVTGGHRFAQTLAEHNQNVAHYRQVVK